MYYVEKHTHGTTVVYCFLSAVHFSLEKHYFVKMTPPFTKHCNQNDHKRYDFRARLLMTKIL